jgi:hypothetical protein
MPCSQLPERRGVKFPGPTWRRAGDRSPYADFVGVAVLVKRPGGVIRRCAVDLTRFDETKANPREKPHP